MPGLIVSVRDADEARLAVAGGAALIDVKEPKRGPLGRADDQTFADILAAVAGRLPVSQARGELIDEEGGPLPDGAAFVKWGPFGAKRTDWRAALLAQRARARCEVVPCAYADVRETHTPTVEEVCQFAIDERFGVVLIDTFTKDGRTLLDHWNVSDLDRLAATCRAGGVRLAVAGSLSLQILAEVAKRDVAWIAVRGAVCDTGREGRLSLDRVRKAAQVVSGDRLVADVEGALLNCPT